MGEPEYDDKMEYTMRTTMKGSARVMPVNSCITLVSQENEF